MWDLIVSVPDHCLSFYFSSYTFCCVFHYLNSQTQDFRYTIPDFQDLTESFATEKKKKNYSVS